MKRVYHPTANSFRDVEETDVKDWTDQGWTVTKKSHIDDSEWPPAPAKEPAPRKAAAARNAPRKAAATRKAPRKADATRKAPRKADAAPDTKSTPTSSGPATGFPEAGKSDTAETVVTTG